jgi:cyanophycin synthetase
LRGRAGDEVPKIMQARLLEKGVKAAAITMIPDEQEAIAAALGMGRQGDLLLIFADALVRSWKQVIKFKPEGAPVREAAPPSMMATEPGSLGEENVMAAMEGLVRDERGIHLPREAGD